MVTVVLAFVGIWLGTLPGVQAFFQGLYGTDADGKAASPIVFLAVTRAGLIGSLLVVVDLLFGARPANLALGAADQLRLVLDRDPGRVGRPGGTGDLAANPGRFPGLYHLQRGRPWAGPCGRCCL